MPVGLREDRGQVAKRYCDQIAEIEAALAAGVSLTKRLAGELQGQTSGPTEGRGPARPVTAQQPHEPENGTTPALDNSLALSAVAIDEQTLGFDHRQQPAQARAAAEIRVLKPRWHPVDHAPAREVSDVLVRAIATKREIEDHLARAGEQQRPLSSDMAANVLKEIDGVLHARARPHESAKPLEAEAVALSHFARLAPLRGAGQAHAPAPRPVSSADTSYDSVVAVTLSGGTAVGTRDASSFATEAPILLAPPTPEWEYATLHRVQAFNPKQRTKNAGENPEDHRTMLNPAEQQRAGLDQEVWRRLEMGDSYNSLLNAPADISIHSQSGSSSFFSVRDFAFGVRAQKGSSGDDLSSSGYLDALARKNDYRPSGISNAALDKGGSRFGRRGRERSGRGGKHRTSRADSENDMGSSEDEREWAEAPRGATRSPRTTNSRKTGFRDSRGLSPAALHDSGHQIYTLANATPEKLLVASDSGVGTSVVSSRSVYREATPLSGVRSYAPTLMTTSSGPDRSVTESTATSKKFGVTFASPLSAQRPRTVSPASQLAATLREVARLDRLPIVSSEIIDAEARKLVRTNRPAAEEEDFIENFPVQTPSRLDRALLEDTAIRVSGRLGRSGGGSEGKAESRSAEPETHSFSLARSEGLPPEPMDGLVLVRG